MRITEAGNVGIGTTTPGSILDVQSTAAAIGTTLKVSNTSASGGNYLQLDRATNSRVNSLNFSTAGVEDWSLGVLRNAGNATQIFSLSYQSAGNINSTGFAVTNTGNVGIGTTSPVAKLHVAGSTYIRNDNTTNQLTIDNDSVGTNASPQYSDILFGGYSTSLRARIRGVDRASNTTIGGLILQSSTDGTTLVDRLFLNGNGESYFYNNSSEVMRITSAGNIEFGKGLNSPKVFSFEADTTGVGNSLGGFQWKNTQWDSNIRASINAITDTALANGALIFSTGATNANATEKMRITSDGNVGINDTAPSDKFVVNGRARINGTNALAFGNNAGGYAQIAVSGATTGNLLFSTYDGAALGERMRITTTGNVGIGTTTPLSSLQVSKNQTSDTAITVTNGGTVGATTTMSFVLQEGGTPQGWFRRYKDNSGLNEIGFSTDLSFSGNVTTTKVERMRITSTGNVGIGTTSPSAKLDLYSSSGGVSFKTYTATTNYTEHSYSKDAGFFIDSYQSVAGSPYTKTTDLVANGDSGAESQMRFFTATTATSPSERMRITSGGNVGIGTTSELARTTILSDSSAQAIGLIGRSADNISTIRWWNNAGNSIYTAIESNANYTIYNTVTNGYAGFYTNNTERMRITSTGNVGIGTTSPTQKLDVVGNAKISGSVQVGDDSATASATNVGATRYRSDANNSYVDMVMQTGASTYAWVNIVQNNW
jgi:hypothetical protein